MSARRDPRVEEALELLLERKVAGIPVVVEDMTLVGIVTEKDLIVSLYTFLNTGGIEHKIALR